MAFLAGLWGTSCLKWNLHLHGRLHLTWPADVFSPSPSSAQLSSVDLTSERKRSTSYTEILVWDEPKWLTGLERGQCCLGAWPWEASWKPEEKRPWTCCQEQETIGVGAALGGNMKVVSYLCENCSEESLSSVAVSVLQFPPSFFLMSVQ